MKWLILLLVLLVVVFLIAMRYRRQIMAGYQLWKMFRQMRQAGKPTVKQNEKRENYCLIFELSTRPFFQLTGSTFDHHLKFKIQNRKALLKKQISKPNFVLRSKSKCRAFM